MKRRTKNGFKNLKLIINADDPMLMELGKDKSIMIFPNDSMSRMTQAAINAKERIDFVGKGCSGHTKILKSR